VVITNFSTVPDPPLVNSNIFIAATVLPYAAASNLAVTSSYRIGKSGVFTNLTMLSTGSNYYVTTGSLPVQGTPGTPIEYRMTVRFKGPAAVSPTNYPVGATNLVLVRMPPFASLYSNVTVTGTLNTNMILLDNYRRMGVVYAAGVTDPSFRFAGSNATATIWGDFNPAASNPLAYGTADIGGSLIPLSGTNGGYIALQFNETNQQYVIQRCAYVNFDNWTGAAAQFKTYTNSDGWVMNARTTASDETNRVFSPSGKSCVLPESGSPYTNVPYYVRTPELANGIGQISFLYRNWETDASRAGAFIVQISPTGTTDWQTVTNVTNILTIDYVRFSLTLADRVSRYVRIVDSTNVSHGALLLDEVVVTEPAAAVTFSGLTNNPFAPTITNRVLVSVNIDPWAGASNLAAAVWFRAGTSGGFDSRPMALASGNLYTGAIPPGAVGVMQYYVSCGFDGFGSEQSSPLYDPYGGYGAALPRGYTNTDVGTFQNFDTWSNAAARGTYTNENWILNEQGQVVSTVGSISPSNAAGLFRSATYTNTYLETPLIVSELGAMTLTFFAKGSRTDLEAAFQVLISTNGTDYEVYTNLTCAGTNWLFYTVILPDYPSYTLRIYISDISLSAGTLYLDNVEIAQPAAMVVASNLMVHPGYPATNDQVYVSCNVDTALQEIPAFNVRGTLWYKPPGSATNRSVAMTRSGNYLLSAAGIPESVWKSTNFYFVQVDFQGYYHTNQNRSPYFYPGTTTVISTNTAIPTNYVVRKFQSDFLEVDADTDAGSATLAQIEHYGWQGVLNVASPTSRLTFAYAGLGHYTGVGYSSGITNWGDSTAWKTNLPLYHAGGPNQSNLTVNGKFESQYLFRFNERTYDYSLQRCKWQDFDNWTTTNYQSSGNDNSVPLTQDFNSWPVNANSSRSEDFSYYKWAGIVTFTNKAFEEVWQGWGIYNSKITNFGYSSYYGCLTTPEDFGYGRGYTVWTPSEDAGTPLRGIGTVSFAYRPGTTNPVFDPVTVGLYLCNTNPPNLYEAPINWEGPYHYATGIASLAWSNITVNINTARTMTVIFAHKFGDTSVLFDNLYVSEWYAITTNVNGWIVSNGWITASGARSGNCCEFDSTRTVDGQSTNQYLRTPRLTNGVGVVDFWYRSATGGTVSLDLQIAPGGSPDNWTTVGSASTSSTNYAPFSAWIVTNADVYLRIRHTTPGYGRLLIDDVRLTQIPVADSWSADNAKMTLDTTREFIRNICILNSDATSEVGFPCNVTIYPNLKTPYLTNGIGEISFWYRNYNAGGTPAARFHVQKSVTGGTNAEEWVDIDVVSNVANTTYSYYRNSIYDASNHYVRIYNETNAPAARLCLDEVLVTDPLATDLRFSQVWPDPTVPLYTNSVHVYATLTDQFLNPSNIAMVTRFGTATNWGGWTTLSNITMTLDSSNLTARPPTYTWRTVTPIPAYTIDTYVVYYPVCTFNGYHTEGTSPKSNAPFATPSWYRPLEFGSSPPYYIVFSCPTGSVWINELNVRDATYDGNRPKYVELCGIAGANISNWYIEILSTSLATQAVYVIRNDWMLTDMTNGYGFWLLGDSMTSNRNMLLTNTLPTSGGGVRLRRSAHMYECAVAYGAPITTLTNAGFVNIGSDSGTRYAPLAAVGTGSTFVDFRWTNNPSESYSPGSINTGQTLTGGGQNEPPPYVEIRAFWIDTNVWIACTGTDTWFFAPWYSTNLIYTNLWTNVVTFTNTFLNGTNTLTFPRPTNAPAYYYKVVGTNTP
jgi:hypothetical protein